MNHPARKPTATRRPGLLKRFRRATAATFLSCLIGALLGASAHAQAKINYNDHLQPLIEANCAKCHNPDKKKADLDLTSFQGALKGSGSGVIVMSGNLDGSKLWKALTHAEEPFMPPNRPKLADKDLDVFKQWILDGLLENAGAKAIAAAKPGLDLALNPQELARPEGPPPMPKELPLEPVVHTARGGAILGLAASPWAPLLAVAGQKQVLLFHADTLELLGILPFEEGQPVDLKFSRNGKLLLASGGRGARSGRVVLWNIISGERLMTVGQEYDTVLAADIRPDQSMVALGGPNRLVKLFSTRTGELVQKIKKHTDWVTAVAFSPNGQVLATADRNGGISLWDPDSAQELFTLAGHKGAVTELSWRADSKLLASASEDGTVKLWDAKEGRQLKSWRAHGPGVLSVSYAPDGQLVTCGRDNAVTVWNGNGGKVRSLDFHGNLPLRVAFTHDSQRVFAADFAGHLTAWAAAQAKPIAQFDADPLPLAEQIATAQNHLKEIRSRAEATARQIGALEAQQTQIKAELETANTVLDSCRAQVAGPTTNGIPLSALVLTNATQKVSALAQTLAAVQIKLVKAHREDDSAAALEEAQSTLGRLQAAQLWSRIYHAREDLAASKGERQKVAASLQASQQAMIDAEKQLAAARKAALDAQGQIKTAKADSAQQQPVLRQLDAELQSSQARLAQWLREYQKLTQPDGQPDGDLAQKQSAH
jgi:DNA-binding beta-propeller fold protein YncE/predicted  nucleic acid-binding Zn-ribbon protein